MLLHDNELKIGWGKTVVLPSQALYTPNAPTHGPAGAAAARAVASSLDSRAGSRWGEPVQPVPSQPAAGEAFMELLADTGQPEVGCCAAIGVIWQGQGSCEL